VEDESFETCPTDVVRATSERVWDLLTDPARFDWLGVKVVEAPARTLAVGDQLRFGPAPGLRLSWTVLSIEPLRTLELDITVPFGIRNHEVIVVSPVGVDSCRVTFN
jgi:Polyketide cyclase / dehydrase and lipid transport